MPPLSLPDERTGAPAAEDILHARKVLARALQGIEGRHRAVLGSGAQRILCFGDPEADTLVVHFHGGGYRQGQPEMVGSYAARLADAAGVEVWCPAYRLAPEHPFPAALIDAIEVRAHLQGRRPRRLVLAGDSAGGGLAAALVQAFAAQGLALAGLILHSPWLDLRVTSDSYSRNAASDPFFSQAAASKAAAAYLQGHDACDPLVSPLLADPADYPPTLLTVGSGEVLLDDALAFSEQFAAAGTQVRLRDVAGMDHIAVIRGPQHTGSQVVFEETVSFLRGLR